MFEWFMRHLFNAENGALGMVNICGRCSCKFLKCVQCCLEHEHMRVHEDKMKGKIQIMNCEQPMLSV